MLGVYQKIFVRNVERLVMFKCGIAVWDRMYSQPLIQVRVAKNIIKGNGLLERGVGFEHT